MGDVEARFLTHGFGDDLVRYINMTLDEGRWRVVSCEMSIVGQRYSAILVREEEPMKIVVADERFEKGCEEKVV